MSVIASSQLLRSSLDGEKEGAPPPYSPFGLVRNGGVSAADPAQLLPTIFSTSPTVIMQTSKGCPQTYHIMSYDAQSPPQPLLTAVFHHGWPAHLQVTLYTGSDPLTRPLAAVHGGGAFNHYFRVTMPEVDSGDLNTGILEPVDLEIHKSHAWHRHGHSASYPFSLDVPRGIGEFEWRATSKADKRLLRNSLDQNSAKSATEPWEFVLVCTSSATSPDGMWRTEDGKEMVAVFTQTKHSWKAPWAFRLLGRGATGEFGARWAVVALASSLRIWRSAAGQRVE